jgi:phosphate transport system substrate-binding protein
MTSDWERLGYEGAIMIDRMSAIRSVGAKLAVGAALAASLSLAACGSTTAGSGPTATPGQTLTSCHATVADITATQNGHATATKDPNASGTMVIDGSSALQPLFKVGAAEYDVANNTTTTVNAGGSGTGLTDVSHGTVKIGMSDLFQADKNISGLTDHQVAVVAFTLVVNSDLKGKVDNLTTAQIQQIYTGAVTNWSQIGGPSEAITVVNRPTTSGTRGTFEKYVLKSTNEIPGNTLTQDNTGAVFQAVNATPGSIGYVSTGFVTSATDAPNAPSPICIDGFKANATDINAGNYQFWNIEHAYTQAPATGNIKAFLTYVESNDFQTKDVPTLNFYQVKTIAAAAVTTHLEASAPAQESFYP